MKRKFIVTLALLTVVSLVVCGCDGSKQNPPKDSDIQDETEKTVEPLETEGLVETSEVNESIKPTDAKQTEEKEMTAKEIEVMTPEAIMPTEIWEFGLPEQISNLNLDECFSYVYDFDNDGKSECFIYDGGEKTYLIKVVSDESKIIFENDETWFPLVVDETMPCLARYEETSEPFTVSFATDTFDSEGFDYCIEYEWSDDGDGKPSEGDILKISGVEVTPKYWNENGGDLWSIIKEEKDDISR